MWVYWAIFIVKTSIYLHKREEKKEFTHQTDVIFTPGNKKYICLKILYKYLKN